MEAVLGQWGSIAWLGIITLLISVLSENLVEAIDDTALNWDVPLAFIRYRGQQ